MQDLFDVIDASWASRWLSNPRGWRRAFGQMVAVSAVLWVILGIDSTWEMLDPFINAVLRNPFSAMVDVFNASSPLRSEMWAMYGMGDHWSAPVIYGLAFIALSRHLEAQGVTQSRNFFVSTSLSLANIGVFELVWNRLYSFLQGQWWSFTLVPKQGINILFFVSFVFVGALSSLLLLGWGLRPKFNRVALVLVALSVVMWAVWVWWPLPIGHITVQTDWGLWTNSNLFPQTYYVVDMTNDGFASGVPNWVQNDALHVWNVLVKVVSTGAMLYMSMMVKKHD